MNIRLSLLFTLALVCAPSAARALTYEYTTFFPERSRGNIATDSSGNIYVAAYGLSATSGATLLDVYKIDPGQSGAASLVWSHTSAFFGDFLLEGIAVDEQGRVAVVGMTEAAGFPVHNGYDETTVPSGFVTVLNAAGDAILYSTRLGAGMSWPMAVAFAGGRVYVAGLTDDDAFPQRHGLVTGAGTSGGQHAFVSVFDPGLSGDASLLYSTTLGDDTGAPWIGLDAGGDVYIAGLSTGSGASQIPATAGSYQTSPDSHWVARLDPTQTGDAALIYATYLGGSGAESRSEGVGGLAVDGAGNAYFVGSTTSTDFPTTSGALQTARAGGEDIFVAKLNPAGSDLVFSTYLGGTGDDVVYGVTVHQDGSVVVTGYSGSGLSFPLSDCAVASSPHATYGGFITRLSADGSALIYSDFLEDTASSSGVSVRPYSGNTTAVLATGSAAVPLIDGFQARGTYPDYLGLLRTDGVCADLALSLPGVPGTTLALVGEVVTIPVQVDNSGPHAVAGVQVTLLGDSGVRALGGIGPVGDCTNDGTDLLCDVGALASGAQALLELYLLPEVDSYFEVVATTTDLELDPSNNQRGAEIDVSAHSGPCGAVTYRGECEDELLRFCLDWDTPSETLHEVDCATLFPDVSGVCSEIDAVYGFDCAVPAGETCFFTDDFGNPVFALCAGSTSACVLDDVAGAATCQEVGTSCAAPVGEAFTPVCDGDLVVVDCQARQPVAYDCAAFGGTCADGSCADLPAGALCNDYLRCDPGLTCHEPTGTCVAPSDVCDADVYVDSCAGSVFTYCAAADHVVEQVECADLFTLGGGTCGVRFTCLDSGDGSCDGVEVGCHGDGEGAPCDLSAGLLCGPGFGCLVESDGQGGRVSRCRAVGTCAFGDEHIGCTGTIATTCFSNSLITAAEAGGVDCAAFDGTCVPDPDTGEPRCVARLEGACDPDNPDGLFTCPPGLECVTDPASGASRCQIAADGGYYDAGGDDATPAPDASVQPDAALPDGAWPDTAQHDTAQHDTGTSLDAGVQPDSAIEQDGGLIRPDAGGDDDEDEGGCGCGDCAAAGVRSGRTNALLLGPALALLLLARRRRH